MSCGPVHAAAGHDAFRHGGGLGKQAIVLLGLLDCADGQSVRTLAEAQGLQSQGWTRTILNRMEEVGLAERDGDGLWTRPRQPDLEQAAEMVGTAGKRERQRRFHTWEQQQREDDVLEWKKEEQKKQRRESGESATDRPQGGSDDS